MQVGETKSIVSSNLTNPPFSIFSDSRVRDYHRGFVVSYFSSVEIPHRDSQSYPVLKCMV
jgi:hypothetical protein